MLCVITFENSSRIGCDLYTSPKMNCYLENFNLTSVYCMLSSKFNSTTLQAQVLCKTAFSLCEHSVKPAESSVLYAGDIQQTRLTLKLDSNE